MVQYNLDIKDALVMATELQTISACAQTNDAIISDISTQESLVVEVMALDFNTVSNEYEPNLKNVFDTIICALKYNMKPVGVTYNLLDYLVSKIPQIKNNIEALDYATLNADEEDMDELNEQYLVQSALLNLVYTLSNSNKFETVQTRRKERNDS